MIWQLTDDKRWSTLRQRFSWVEDMHNTPQDPEHHGEGDVGVHTEMVLNALVAMAEFQQLPAQQQEILWAAALLHDVEKRSTTVQENGRIQSLVMLVGGIDGPTNFMARYPDAVRATRANCCTGASAWVTAMVTGTSGTGAFAAHGCNAYRHTSARFACSCRSAWSPLS